MMKKVILSFCFSVALFLPAACRADIAAVEKSFLEGRYERAAYDARCLIDERARQRYELYYLKGLSELKLGKFNDARQSFKAIITNYSKSPRFFDAYVGMGDAYLLEGNIDEAAKIYAGIKARFPSDSNIALVDARLSDCRKKSGPAAAAPAAAEVKPLDPGEPGVSQSAVSQDEEVQGRISVQVGCFKNRRNADRLSEKLTNTGYESYVELPLVSKDNLYRVKVGRLKTQEEAESLAARLKREGYRTKVCDETACR
ncbi:MAG: SPOR domain-containing protein [Candidatus Omnitrophota bacterium]